MLERDSKISKSYLKKGDEQNMDLPFSRLMNESEIVFLIIIVIIIIISLYYSIKNIK